MAAGVCRFVILFDSTAPPSVQSGIARLHPSAAKGVAAIVVPMPDGSVVVLTATGDADVFETNEIVVPNWMATHFAIQLGWETDVHVIRESECAAMPLAVNQSFLSVVATPPPPPPASHAGTVSSVAGSGTAATSVAVPPPTPLPTFAAHCKLPVLCVNALFALSMIPQQITLFRVTKLSGTATAAATVTLQSSIVWHAIRPASQFLLLHSPAANTNASAAVGVSPPSPAVTPAPKEGHVIFDATAPTAAAVSPSVGDGKRHASAGGSDSAIDPITSKLHELTRMIDTFFSIQLSTAIGGGGGGSVSSFVSHSRALLLTGSSGVGKTYLCQRLQSYYTAAATAKPVTVLYASALDILSSAMAAEDDTADVKVASDEKMPAAVTGTATVLTRLLSRAVSESPALVLLDDLDGVIGQSESEDGASGGEPSASSGAGARCGRDILNWLDGINSGELRHSGIAVIGLVKNAAVLPAKYLRAGRFDHFTTLAAPTLAHRKLVLCELIRAITNRFPNATAAALATAGEHKSSQPDSTAIAGLLSTAAAAAPKAATPRPAPVTVARHCLDWSDVPSAILESAQPQPQPQPQLTAKPAPAGAVPAVAIDSRFQSVEPLCDLLARLTPAYVLRDLNRFVTHTVLFALARTVRQQQTATPSGATTATGADTKAADVKTAAAPAAASEVVPPRPPAVTLRWCDFAEALQHTRPAQLSSSLDLHTPNVSWSSIGGYAPLKQRLQSIVRQWTNASGVTRLGFRPVSGVLLYGASGTGKTMMAQAMASDASLNFISVSGSDLFSKYFGDSERMVRQLFARARESAPCVLLLDEIDAIAPSRSFNSSGEGSDSSGGVGGRVLSTLLNEMDGIERRVGVYIVAATNRLDALDAALIRAGRLDELIPVDAPAKDDIDTRYDILKVGSRTMKLHSDVDLRAIASQTAGLSGAELVHACREAALYALRTDGLDVDSVRHSHFLHALTVIAKPS